MEGGDRGRGWREEKTSSKPSRLRNLRASVSFMVPSLYHKFVAILAQAPILAQDQKYLGPGHAQPAILLPATRRIGRLLNGLSIPEACARC